MKLNNYANEPNLTDQEIKSSSQFILSFHFKERTKIRNAG